MSLVLLTLPVAAAHAAAKGSTLATALAAAEAQDAPAVDSHLRQLDSFDARLVEWVWLLHAPSSAFSLITSFVAATPGWPGVETLRRKADDVAAGADADPVAEWYGRFPPSQPQGMTAFSTALERLGRGEEARRWRLHAERSKVAGSEAAVDRELRRLMRSEDAQKALSATKAYADTPGPLMAEAHWVMGWLQLRRSGKPAAAVLLFAAARDLATTPTARSRADYWRAVAALAAGDVSGARPAMVAAASRHATFYGQLALHSLGTVDGFELSAPAEPGAQEVAALRESPLVYATRRLLAAERPDLAYEFFEAAVTAFETPGGQTLMARLADELAHPHWLVQAADRVGHHGAGRHRDAYPVKTLPPDTPVESSLVLAITRQESAFNPRARSAVGALGLMQLMPATARDVAARLGLPFDHDRLFEPDYNLRLGAVQLHTLLHGFDGSLVLTAAAYNAGPGNVHAWMRDLGDPRKPDVDVIDWIEKIPVAETRGYVKRVLENRQVYRHVLAGAPVRLELTQDLRPDKK